jgi:secreted trypsin-like serine protease
MKTATIKTHAIDDCKKAFNQKLITDTDYEDTIFCAQETDFCQGNAGAPAQEIIRNGQKSIAVLYGMPSLGPSVCSIGFYTNVAHYKDWIMNNLE